jgi:protein ImuA
MSNQGTGMQFISCHDGKLQTLEAAGLKVSPARAFATGLEALDALAPQQTFARGAVHELLFERSHGQPKFVAAVIAGAATNQFNIRLNEMLPLVWADPRGEVYPPALTSLGFDLSKLYLLHPKNLADEAWAVAECLRCRGVGAVIASPPSLSRIEARRLQLAAERGGTVGILLRQKGRGESIYAAATRWLVAPYRGERTIQRWTIQLLHGHGGRVGQTVFLEWNRETNTVRATEKLSRRQVATRPAQRAIA